MTGLFRTVTEMCIVMIEDWWDEEVSRRDNFD